MFYISYPWKVITRRVVKETKLYQQYLINYNHNYWKLIKFYNIIVWVDDKSLDIENALKINSYYGFFNNTDYNKQ